VKILAYGLFYGYVGTLVTAGAWGIVGARLDQRLLLGLSLRALDPASAASLLSQYRFLRAVEFGFGLFALIYRVQIFTVPVYNRLFLATMTLGVLSRVISLAVDGSPRPAFYFFLLYEAIGVVAIYAHSRRTMSSP
jgi:hypothetical protein